VSFHHFPPFVFSHTVFGCYCKRLFRYRRIWVTGRPMFWWASMKEMRTSLTLSHPAREYVSSCSSGNSSTGCPPLSTHRKRESFSTNSSSTRRVFKLLNVLNNLHYTYSIFIYTSTDRILFQCSRVRCSIAEYFSLGEFKIRVTEDTCQLGCHQSTLVESVAKVAAAR
jgi:hypothetical protein